MRRRLVVKVADRIENVTMTHAIATVIDIMLTHAPTQKSAFPIGRIVRSIGMDESIKYNPDPAAKEEPMDVVNIAKRSI